MSSSQAELIDPNALLSVLSVQTCPDVSDLLLQACLALAACLLAMMSPRATSPVSSPCLLSLCLAGDQNFHFAESSQPDRSILPDTVSASI